MIEDTRTRLRTFIEKKGHSVASFEKSIGASNGAISLFMIGKNKGLGNNLEKILICYQELNAGWLLLGKGSMLISDIDLSRNLPQDIINNLTIGEFIAGARKAKGMTQADLSDLIGKSRSSIAQIEKGIIKADFDFIKDFVKKLNIPYHLIFDLPNDFEQRLTDGKSKNEMYIKQPPEGVRIESQKGGEDRGEDWPKNQNQMYIKHENQEKPPSIVSQPAERYGYRPDGIDELISVQRRLFSEILERLERLEATQGTSSPKTPENG